MHAERTRLRPYPLPDLVLPAQSEWQTAIECAPSIATVLRFAIARVTCEHEQVIERFETSLPSPAAFAAWMERYAGDLASAATLAEANRPASESTQITSLVDATDRIGANHAIYDQFFRVTRSPGLSSSAFAAAILSTSTRVLLDLPYSTIARHETFSLLRAMTRGLALVAGPQPGEEAGPNVVPFTPANRVAGMAEEIADGWELSDVDPEWLIHVADHRWISGHHLFFLFANFCRVSLDRATQALAVEKHDDIARCLIDAGLFQRALASAMWYAGDFPPALYRSHTRAWMSSAGAANGFSGSDNVDYTDLHKSREATVNGLFAAFGSDAETWPAPVEHAFRSFHEMEIQHAEHHVLIAARMVGTDTSLVQKRMRRAVYNAVDVLRDMVAEEWTELANRFS